MRPDIEVRLRRARNDLGIAAASLALGGSAAERRAADQARVALRYTESALGVKVCLECGEEFTAASRRSDAVYCSQRCAERRAQREHRKRANG